MQMYLFLVQVFVVASHVASGWRFRVLPDDSYPKLQVYSVTAVSAVFGVGELALSSDGNVVAEQILPSVQKGMQNVLY